MNTCKNGATHPVHAAGFSLLEVVIAAVILFLLIGASASVLGSGQKLLNSTSVASSGDQLAEYLAGVIADRMRNATLEDLKDANGVPIPDNPNFDPSLFVYDSVQFREVVGFQKEPILRKTIWIHAIPDGETDVSNQKDEDEDNMWDERQLHIREYPINLPSSSPPAPPPPPPPSLPPAPTPLLVKDFRDTGMLAGSLGIFDMDEAIAKGLEQPLTVLGGFAVTRSGKRVMVTVGILRVDTQNRNPDRSPRVRGFRGTAFVNLYN